MHDQAQILLFVEKVVFIHGVSTGRQDSYFQWQSTDFIIPNSAVRFLNDMLS